MVRTQDVTDSISRAFSFLKIEYKELFKDFYKVELFSIFVSLAGILLFSLPLVLGYFLFNSATGFLLAAIFYVIFALLIVSFGSKVISSTLYNFLDARVSKIHVNIIEKAKENMFPYLCYSTIVFLIKFVIAIPFAVVIFGGTLALALSTPDALTDLLIDLGDTVFRLVLSVPYAIIDLFLLFVIFELLINRKGIIESFKLSIQTVKSNFFESVLFGFMLWVILLGVGIASLIALLLLLVPVAIIAIIFGFIGSLAGPVVGLAIGIIIGSLLAVPILIAVGVVSSMVEISCVYFYWGKLTGTQDTFSQ